MKRMWKKRSLSLSLVFIFLVGILLNFPINANAVAISPSPYNSSIVLGSNYVSTMNVILDNSGNNIYLIDYTSGKIVKMGKGGENVNVIASSLNQPIGMVFDDNGDLYVALHNGRKIIKIDNSTGQVSDVATGFSGLLTGIVFDSSKQYLYVADYQYGKIIKVKKDGSTKTDFATGFATSSLIGMDIDSNDNLYVADSRSNSIKKVDTNGNITSFKTGLSGPTWVTVDGYGYVYISDTNNRMIKKSDNSGSIITSFSTGTSTPWGTAIDSSGYIYFADISQKLYKVVGKGNAISPNQISLEMNNELVGTVADPSAFTIHGAVSNPTVTRAEVSGKNVTLTLSSDISNADSSITVDYTKSGTDNMIGNMKSGTTVQLDSFAGLPIQNSIVSATSISTLPSINVAYGTTQGELVLPQSINVTLSNSTTASAAIVWDTGNPVYDGNTSGTYRFSGTLTLPNNVSNPSNLKATVDVVVGQVVTRPIIFVSSLHNINAAYGTIQRDLLLPENVTVGLSNSTTASAAIVWDAGNPIYNGNNSGTYRFSGTLSLPSNVSNPANLKATVDVVVGQAGEPVIEPPTPIVTTSQSVEIIGTQKVGKVLSTKISDENGNNINIPLGATYEWYRLSNPSLSPGILVGTDRTYKLVNADKNQYIKVIVNYDGKILEDITSRIENKSSSNSSSSSSSEKKAITGNGVSTKPTNDESTLGVALKEVSGYKVALTNSWGDKTLGGTVSNIVDNNGNYVGSTITANESGLAKLPIEYSESKDLKYIYKYDPKTKLFIKVEGTLNANNDNIEISVNKGETYYVTKAEMSNNTVLNEGWNTINNVTYRVEGSNLKNGWILENNVWYYLDETSKARVENNWDVINNKWYFFNEKGQMTTGWRQQGDTWYYLDANTGAMSTGWNYINNTWYYLYSDGAMAKNTVIDNYTISDNGAWVN